jgi:hypothetical protein
VQRSGSSSGPWTQVGTPAGTSFSDTGLAPTTTYYYRVLASNSGGDSTPSSVASATTLAATGCVGECDAVTLTPHPPAPAQSAIPAILLVMCLVGAWWLPELMRRRNRGSSRIQPPPRINPPA